MTKPTIAELDTRLAVAEERLDVMRGIEDRLTKTFNARFDKLEAKLNNGISDEIRKNTQFRKVGTWVVGVVGTVILSGFAVAIWKLLVNLDKLLEIANNVK